MRIEDTELLKFRKQFFLCRSEQNYLPSKHWTGQRLHDGWNLFHHKDLEVSVEESGNFKLALLGNAYDLDFTSRTNGEVATSLVQAAAARSEPFAGIEDRLSKLSGRHVVLAFTHDDNRIYHDAGGLKSVFFANEANGGLSVGSQPALLEYFGRTTRDASAYDAFVAKPHSASFSPYFVPYVNVTQLLPNRYLSLRRGSVHRFWPAEECQEIPMQESAERILRLTRASVEALSLRNKLAITLTGGFDSRMILAAADPEVRERLKIATCISASTPDHDRWIPKRIGKVLGLEIHQPNIDELPASESGVIRQLHCNIGGMSFDASLPRVLGVYEALGDHIQGPGLCCEVFRSHYSYGSVGAEALTPQMLADTSGFHSNKLAALGYRKWLSEFPEGWTSRQLDLLHWEGRLGIWASAHLAFKEALFEVSPPMNNRSILSAGLCAPRDARCAPYNLAREVIRQGDTRLLGVPFNKDRTHIRLRRRLRRGINGLKSIIKTTPSA